jgi:predicted HicB family RNase H-like nuclease
MKDLLRYKGFLGSIEISVSDNCIHGKLLFIDDLVTYEAESPSQLKVEFEAAVEDYLETCKELKRSPIKPFSGTFNVRIGPELHQNLAQYAITRESSINDVVRKAVVAYLDKPEPKEVIHKHFHTYQYEEKFDIQEENPWKKEPILRFVN